jgi:hypothetical protein
MKTKTLIIYSLIILIIGVAVGFFVGSAWGTKNTVKITKMVQPEPVNPSGATVGLSAEITSALDKYYKPRRGMAVSDGEAEGWWKIREMRGTVSEMQALEMMLREIIRLTEVTEALYEDLGFLRKIEHRKRWFGK